MASADAETLVKNQAKKISTRLPVIIEMVDQSRQSGSWAKRRPRTKQISGRARKTARAARLWIVPCRLSAS